MIFFSSSGAALVRASLSAFNAAMRISASLEPPFASVWRPKASPASLAESSRLRSAVATARCAAARSSRAFCRASGAGGGTDDSRFFKASCFAARSRRALAISSPEETAFSLSAFSRVSASGAMRSQFALRRVASVVSRARTARRGPRCGSPLNSASIFPSAGVHTFNAPPGPVVASRIGFAVSEDTAICESAEPWARRRNSFGTSPGRAGLDWKRITVPSAYAATNSEPFAFTAATAMRP